MHARNLAISSGSLGLLAIMLILTHESAHSPVFFLGLTLLIIASMLAIGAFFARSLASFDKAFQAGQRVGFRKGERHRRHCHLTSV